MLSFKWQVRSNRFPELTRAARQQAEDAVAATVFAVEGGAKAVVPVDTGALKNSINGFAEGLAGEVAASMDYAVYVEYGTYKMGAQPYMTPAAEAAWPQFVAAMAEIFG